jgi:hypothetical protein
LPDKIVYRAWGIGVDVSYAGKWGSAPEISSPPAIELGAAEQETDMLARTTSGETMAT